MKIFSNPFDRTYVGLEGIKFASSKRDQSLRACVNLNPGRDVTATSIQSQLNNPKKTGFEVLKQFELFDFHSFKVNYMCIYISSGLVTRKLYFKKKRTLNGHFSRPAETDPYAAHRSEECSAISHSMVTARRRLLAVERPVNTRS